MRYIEKRAEPSTLSEWKVNNHDTLLEMYQDETISSSSIWRFLDDCQEPSINKKVLKQQLLEEQGYLCCYCGCRIFNDHNTVIEHLASKSNHRSLTYDYDNLLASCMGGSKPIIHKVEEGEDLNSISKKYGVDIEFLETVYVNTNYSPSHFPDIENLQIGDRLIIFKKLKESFQHCDNKKGNDEIGITPLQPNCTNKFNFDKRTGAIIETEENSSTLKSLGLNNNPYLLQNRLKVINEAIRKIQLVFIQISVPALRKEKIQQIISQLNSPNSQNQLRPWCFIEISTLKGK